MVGCSTASATAGICAEVATALLRSWLASLGLGAALAAAAALCAPIGAELQAATQIDSSPSGTAVSGINLLTPTSKPEGMPPCYCTATPRWWAEPALLSALHEGSWTGRYHG